MEDIAGIHQRNDDVQVCEVTDSSHYLAEEPPEDFVQQVLTFVQ